MRGEGGVESNEEGVWCREGVMEWRGSGGCNCANDYYSSHTVSYIGCTG